MIIKINKEYLFSSKLYKEYDKINSYNKYSVEQKIGRGKGKNLQNPCHSINMGNVFYIKLQVCILEQYIPNLKTVEQQVKEIYKNIIFEIKIKGLND